MKISGKPRRQRGIALLMILAIAGIVAVVLVGNALIRKHTEQERLAVTQAALAQAKEALIAYAVARMDRDYEGAPDVPGRLPCPSLSLPSSANEEGYEELSCGAKNVTVVGRLPWKSLGIPPPRDGSGECLWYAVSGRFKNYLRGDIVNWDTEGQLRLLAPNGQVIANKIAAVIFAPGPALGQTRVQGTRAGYAAVSASNMPTCPGSYTPADYLEEVRDAANNLIASNRAMTPNTITGVPATSTVMQGGGDPATGTVKVNDRIATVTTAEIFAAVKRRGDFDDRIRVLVSSFATCIATYAQNSLGRMPLPPTLTDKDRRMPWPAALAQTHDVRVDTETALRSPLDVGATVPLAGRAAESTPSSAQSSFGGAESWKYFMNATPGPTVGSDTCATFTNASTPNLKNWWRNWRDHIFYAVSGDFSPASTPPPPGAPLAQSCIGRCLQVGTSTVNTYPALVIFAGEALPTQSRRNNSDLSLADNAADADRNQAINYLEHRNEANIRVPPAEVGTVSNPVACTSSACTASRHYGPESGNTAPYNDLLYCIADVPGGTPSVDLCRCGDGQPPLIARKNGQLPHLRVCTCDLSRPGSQPSEPGQSCP